MKALKLLFIRHAQSTGNQQKRMQGNGNYELSPEGQQQAEKLAHRLFLESWWPSHIYSSPLLRAAQTAEILRTHALSAPLPSLVSDLVDGIEAEPAPAAVTSAPLVAVEYADELREFQNGIFEGLTWEEARQQYPELCHQLETTADWIQIPGAESLLEARARAHQFIQSLLLRHQNGDQIWVVSHSWILQHLIAELLGCERSWRLHARNTALFEFWIDQSRWSQGAESRFNTDLWQIRRFNDCYHLL